MKIFYSLLFIVIGVLIMRYTAQLTEWFGNMGIQTSSLQGGTLYRLAGLAIIIISLLFMFDALGFLSGPLGPLFGSQK